MQFGWSSTGILLDVYRMSAGGLLDVYWGLCWTWEGDLGQGGLRKPHAGAGALEHS